MRGTAPALVAIFGTLGSGRASARARMACHSGHLRWASSACSSTQARSAAATGGAIGLALANSIVIAGYTMIDGIGVRKSGSPVAYALWITVLTAIPLLVWAIARHRKTLHQLRAFAERASHSPAAPRTTASYGLALIAMTHAPIAMVAALRETSILFATAISTVVLHEHVGWARWVASGSHRRGRGFDTVWRRPPKVSAAQSLVA